MILGAALGLVVGLALAFATHLARRARLAAALRLAEARLSDAQATVERQQAELAAVANRAAEAETARAVAAAELELVRREATETSARAEENRTRLAGAFAELSAQALAKNNEQFLALADTRFNEARAAARGDLDQRQTSIAQLLSPLSETLARYERGIQQLEAERRGAYAGLSEKVAQLHVGHQELQRETRNLVTALRVAADARSLGRDAAAARGGDGRHARALRFRRTGLDLRRGRTPASGHGRAHAGRRPGRRRRQGAARRLLASWWTRTTTSPAALHRARHARQLRTHVEHLAKKEYWRQFDRSPQMVVAFIPGDQLLAAAFEADPALQEHAMANNVLLTTPVTLIALLRTVALSWRQETMAENAREVQKLGAELYERLRAMTGHMQSLQRSLTTSVEAYNRAVGSLESRVLVTARRFPSLGVVVGESSGIVELSSIEAAPRRLQAVEAEDDDDGILPTILTLPEGGASSGTPA